MTAGPVGRAVGFVGLGHMGTPIVSRLVDAGVTVRAYDASDSARSACAAVVPGAVVVDDLAAVAVGSEAVLLCLPNSAVVEAVLEGPGGAGGAGDPGVDAGLCGALEPGALVVDLSSSEPRRTRDLAGRLAAHGHVLLDAPVSGGVAGAVAGTLAVMVGGPDDAVATLRQLLETFGRPTHVGDVGAGHALKALNNLLSASHLLASSEALLIGQEFGLDPEVMLEVVNASSGRSGSTQTKWPRDVLPGAFASGFGLALMVKDIHIALELAGSTGGTARHMAATVALWDEAAAALPSDADHTEIVRWLRGETVDGPGPDTGTGALPVPGTRPRRGDDA